MTKRITISGDKEYVAKISDLLKLGKVDELMRNANIQEFTFLQESIRSLDVDVTASNGGSITIYGIPNSEKEFEGLLKFGLEIITTKTKTQLTFRWIYKEHGNCIRETVADLDSEVLESFAKQATRQIEYADNSVLKLISLQNLDEHTRDLISDRLSNGLTIPTDGEVDYASVVNGEYWRKVGIQSKIIETFERKIGSQSTIICKAQMACLEAYRSPTAVNVKKAAQGITELVMASCGWSDNLVKVGGSTPYG